MEAADPIPKPPGRFYGELESARGLAALLVAGFHCGQARFTIGETTAQLSKPSAHNSWPVLESLFHLFVNPVSFPHLGVLFFFVLSGFVLTDSLQKGPRAPGTAGARFFLARFFRIYPAIISTVLVFWAAHALFGLSMDPNGYSLSSILKNCALLAVNIDGVMWTIQIELLALPLIFLAFFFRQRAGGLALIALTILLCLLAFWGPWGRLVPGPPSRTQWLFLFPFGILAYHFGERFFARMPKSRLTVVFLLSTAVFFLAGSVVHHIWQNIVQAVTAAVVIAILAFGTPIAASAILRTQLLRFLGRVSYSFYLLHPLALTIIWKRELLFGRWINQGVPPIVLALALWIVTTLAILPLAWLMYRLVEVPFVRFGKRLWKRLAAPSLAEIRNPLC
ncbi:MAG: acyltransferase [Chthoniobacterales bacterium]